MYNAFFKYFLPFVMLNLIQHLNITAQQNLVMNPSFEEYNYCPVQAPDVLACKYVFNPQCDENNAGNCLSTSDYFHSCASISSNVNTPYCYAGYQYPKGGNAFLGFAGNRKAGYREYIQIKLSKPLEPYSVCKFSFFVNLANRSGVTTDAIGVKFTADSIIYTNNYLWEFMQPDWVNESGNFITDTVNWVKLEGEATVKGNEQWMIIGVFYPNKEFPNLVVSQGGNQYEDIFYFYIDSLTSFEYKATPFITIPNVFTPNEDGINDTWKLQYAGYEFNSLSIYNRWGNLIYQSKSNDYWEGINLSNSNVSEGIYYYSIEFISNDTNTKEYRKGFVQLLR